ncbi:hypothetical protein [Streptomyces sp. NPDC059819]|uniref:hypothetical protein n=1 Tax=Streptomyces sp. NPDC059819 TaxID=3346963 RepID=UPI003663F58D
MDLQQFATRFRDDIRVMIDWTQLADANTYVSVRTLAREEARRHLARLFTVWYTSPEGEDSLWIRPGSQPLRVGEAGRTAQRWPEVRTHAVADLVQAYTAAPEPVPLNIPAYAVDDGRFLLLDGNHRAVAAHRAGAAVRLTLFALHGPVCETVLPDLRHYGAPPP